MQWVRINVWTNAMNCLDDGNAHVLPRRGMGWIQSAIGWRLVVLMRGTNYQSEDSTTKVDGPTKPLSSHK